MKIIVGSSDIARVIIDSPQQCLHWRFTEDGTYYADVVDTEPKGLTPFFECNHWISIYDDEGRTFHAFGKVIKVYEEGIIYLENGEIVDAIPI